MKKKRSGGGSGVFNLNNSAPRRDDFLFPVAHPPSDIGKAKVRKPKKMKNPRKVSWDRKEFGE
jgi:hypothetical protein